MKIVEIFWLNIMEKVNMISEEKYLSSNIFRDKNA